MFAGFSILTGFLNKGYHHKMASELCCTFLDNDSSAHLQVGPIYLTWEQQLSFSNWLTMARADKSAFLIGSQKCHSISTCSLRNRHQFFHRSCLLLQLLVLYIKKKKNTECVKLLTMFSLLIALSATPYVSACPCRSRQQTIGFVEP